MFMAQSYCVGYALLFGLRTKNSPTEINAELMTSNDAMTFPSMTHASIITKTGIALKTVQDMTVGPTILTV